MSLLLRAALIAVLSFWLSGCAILAIDPPLRYVQLGPNSVWVDQPMDTESEAFTVRFGPDFVPGSFKASLDGVDITQTDIAHQWVPGNPTPNGVAKLLYTDIFRGGSCSPRADPNGFPPLSPTVCTHTLHAHGDVANASSYSVTFTEKSVDFVPVHLGLRAKDSTGRYFSPDDTLGLAPGQSVTVTLTADTYGPWPSEQTAVVAALDLLSGENPATHVSLNGMSPGQTLFLSTLPANFTVTVVGDLGPGPGRFAFRLRARAFGCQEAVYGNLFACRVGGC